MSHEGTKRLNEIYYDLKHGFSGVDDLIRKTRYSKKAVEEWLGKQELYTIHNSIKHKFKTSRFLVTNIDDQWQAIFSRYAKAQ